MTSKKAFAIWVLVVFTFLTILDTLHAWILWKIEGVNTITIFSFSTEVTTYFATTLIVTFLFIGAICYIMFNKESLEEPLFKLGRDFEEKLHAKSEEIKSSTDEAMNRLGLREYQSRETIQALKNELKGLETKLTESMETHKKSFEATQKKLIEMETKMDQVQPTQKESPILKRKLQAIETVEKDVKSIQEMVAKLESSTKPYITSTSDLNVLKGKILKPETVEQLKRSGIAKVENLILKSPVEIALTEAMSESEAKSLQSVIQLLMIPGIRHEDAVILLKSGISSKQELALQDTFSLGAKVAKTAEIYVQEGKIKEEEKPSLEDIASWIKFAKM